MNTTPEHYRGDIRFAPSQWETSLQSNAVSHWLGADLESVLTMYSGASVTPCSFQCSVPMSTLHVLTQKEGDDYYNEDDGNDDASDVDV